VGTPDPMAVYGACQRVSDQVAREVSPTIMTPDEIAQTSGFLTQVRNSPTVPIIGDVPWQ
jgi:hypothetical protein